MMHTIGLLVFPDFQALGLAVSTVFEYANLMHTEKIYHFRLVSEHGGPVMTSHTFSVNTERITDANYDTLMVGGDNDCKLPSPELLHCRSRAAGW